LLSKSSITHALSGGMRAVWIDHPGITILQGLLHTVTYGISAILSTGIDSLINLQNLYKDGNIVKKREIIGSIYPEKLTFNGFSYRIARLNEAVRLIYSLDADFSRQKNRTRSKKIDLSCFVTSSGFKPETF
jgi:site-specific DNA recombinase